MRILVFLTLALWVFCRTALEAADASCPAPSGDQSGNYMVPGTITNISYHDGMTLDAFAPAGAPRPAAILMHGSNGDQSTHLTQLFGVLERAGFAFPVLYQLRNARRCSACRREYIRCPGKIRHHLPADSDRRRYRRAVCRSHGASRQSQRSGLIWSAI